MFVQKSGTAIPSLLTNFMEKQSTAEVAQEEELEQAVQDVAFTTYSGKLFTLHLSDSSKTDMSGLQALLIRYVFSVH